MARRILYEKKNYFNAGYNLFFGYSADWLFKNNNPDMDMGYIEGEMARLRLADFHQNLCRMMDSWFADGKPDEITDYLTDFFFSSGSWGSKQNFQRFMAMKQKKLCEIEPSRSKRGMLLLFPGLKIMQDKYPVLTKAPWLLPLMWPVRWVTVLLFRRKNITLVKESWKYSSDKEINEYEASLQYVGLHYDG